MTGEKFTDGLVAGYMDELGPIAEKYVRAYEGDSEFLVDLQDRLEGRADWYGPVDWSGNRPLLTIAQVRGILNWMRRDSSVSNLPDPEKMPLRRVSKVKKRSPYTERPPWIVLPTTWHYNFGITNARNSSAIHRLDHRRSTIKWYPHILEFQVQLSWRCGADVRGWKEGYPNVELLHEADARKLEVLTPGWHLCKSCQRM